MADIVRTGSAAWHGDLRNGKGTLSAGTGIKDVIYSFHSRFENGSGTNPEELIASAHASCFSMALAKVLADQGHPPQEIRTKASLTMVKTASGFKLSRMHLQTEGVVPDLDEAGFRTAAETAKATCPVSLLLQPGLEEIALEARLAG